MLAFYFTKMYPDVLPPRLGTPESVGADIHAYLKTESGRPSKMMIPARAVRAIPTGLIVAAHSEHALFVCSRSGMAKNQTLFVANSPGVIDPDYRGEVFVLLYNGGDQPQWIEHEYRIAQIVQLKAASPIPVESQFDLGLQKTLRGDGAFGSTGR